MFGLLLVTVESSSLRYEGVLFGAAFSLRPVHHEPFSAKSPTINILASSSVMECSCDGTSFGGSEGRLLDGWGGRRLKFRGCRSMKEELMQVRGGEKQLMR